MFHLLVRSCVTAFLFVSVVVQCARPARSLLHWYAPFFSGGGYSSEALEIALAGESVNVSMVIHQHGDARNAHYSTKVLSKEHRGFLSSHNPRPFSDVPLTRSERRVDIIVCHSEPGAWHAPLPRYHTEAACPPPPTSTPYGVMSQSSTGRKPTRRQYNIGRTMFETNRIPSGWIERCNYMDEVWVPTEFARDIFVAEGVQSDKIRVVPEPINTEFYAPVDIEELFVERGGELPHDRLSVPLKTLLQWAGDGPNAKSLHSMDPVDYARDDHDIRISGNDDDVNGETGRTVVFLFVGKWETRKGIDILLDAYLEEFQSNENVLLLILSSGYHSSEPIGNKLSKVVTEILSRSHRGNGNGNSAEKEEEEVVVPTGSAIEVAEYILHVTRVYIIISIGMLRFKNKTKIISS